MSLVVAVRRHGKIVMGADSIALSGTFKNTISELSAKLWRHGAYTVGHCGGPRDRSLIQHAGPWPDPCDDGGMPAFVHHNIIPSMRAALSAGGATQKEKESDRFESSFMVSVGGYIFSIFGDFQVEFASEHYAAIGGGRDTAYGAMAALELAAPQLDAKSAVLAALDATERHYTGCARPWVILDASPKS